MMLFKQNQYVTEIPGIAVVIDDFRAGSITNSSLLSGLFDLMHNRFVGIAMGSRGSAQPLSYEKSHH